MELCRSCISLPSLCRAWIGCKDQGSCSNVLSKFNYMCQVYTILSFQGNPSIKSYQTSSNQSLILHFRISPCAWVFLRFWSNQSTKSSNWVSKWVLIIIRNIILYLLMFNLKIWEQNRIWFGGGSPIGEEHEEHPSNSISLSSLILELG